jgi:hypothetical protein
MRRNIGSAPASFVVVLLQVDWPPLCAQVAKTVSTGSDEQGSMIIWSSVRSKISIVRFTVQTEMNSGCVGSRRRKTGRDSSPTDGGHDDNTPTLAYRRGQRTQQRYTFGRPAMREHRVALAYTSTKLVTSAQEICHFRRDFPKKSLNWLVSFHEFRC